MNMKMKGPSSSHYIPMFIIMIMSGLLSTMNVFADKWSDIRWSLNDLYMSLLMTGWMFLFMGIYNQTPNIFVFGLTIVIIAMFFIRYQLFIDDTQYLLGMIPHHSMAIYLSKKMLQKPNCIQNFLRNIIYSQEKEIEFMKNVHCS